VEASAYRDTLQDTYFGYFTHELKLQLKRRCAKETCNEVKFSPKADRIALGSNDNHIYIYAVKLGLPDDPLKVEAVFMHKLTGHSSYIKHIDWSADGELMQSCCGAYELL
jgi:WD40 repeat protein